MNSTLFSAHAFISDSLIGLEALLIVYDAQAGLSSFQMTLSTIKKHLV